MANRGIFMEIIIKAMLIRPLLTPRLLEAEDVDVGLGGRLHKLNRFAVKGISLGRHRVGGAENDRVLDSSHLYDD